MILYLLLIVSSQACDFPIYKKITPLHKDTVYIVRQMNVNRQFHEQFTMKNLNESLYHRNVHTMSPWKRPGNFKQAVFSEFLNDHIKKYEDMSLSDIIIYPEDRMIYPFLYSPNDIRMDYNNKQTTQTIIPKHISKLHSCSHLSRIGPTDRFNAEYFIGARGQGANFHKHNEIFTQITSGKKLWMVISDFDHVDIGPEELIASNIRSLLKNKRVKRCMAYAGDLIHIPKNTIHGSFNYKTTLASGCIL